MPRHNTPTPSRRVRVIDPLVIAHTMEHPARGNRWSVRELAERIGCSPALLGHIRRGTRTTLPRRLAERFAEAVGCETAVLFVDPLSTESDTNPTEGDAA